MSSDRISRAEVHLVRRLLGCVSKALKSDTTMHGAEPRSVARCQKLLADSAGITV